MLYLYIIRSQYYKFLNKMINILKKSKLLTVLIVILLISSTNSSQQLSAKPIKASSIATQTLQKAIQKTSSQSFQIDYTQNVKQFKTKRYNQRLQVVVGCWLLSKEYIQNQKSDYLFNQNQAIKQILLLNLVKQCMKNIKRKDAVLKITALVSKNMQHPKTYQQIVKDKNLIDQILIKVNSQNIIKVNSLNIINDNQIIQQRQIDNHEEIILQNYMQNKQSNQTINKIRNQSLQIDKNQQIQKTDKNQQIQKIDKNQQIQKSQTQQSSQFDIFLLNLLKKYTSQFKQIQSAKDGIKGRVQEELKKRQKYYFGFIPASEFTHSVFLVTISLSMVFVCTCYRYYKMRSAQPKKSLNGNQQAPPQKTIKKMGTMSQITFKKKRK